MRLDIDRTLRDRIVDLAKENYDDPDGRFEGYRYHSIYLKQLSSAAKARARGLDDSEEKTLGRLGITYGVLMRLGISGERVEECLRAMQGVDLDEAYDWVSFSLFGS